MLHQLSESPAAGTHRSLGKVSSNSTSVSIRLASLNAPRLFKRRSVVQSSILASAVLLSFLKYSMVRLPWA